MSCVEKSDCKNDEVGRLGWQVAMGSAEAGVYVCENSDLREG